MIWENHTGHDVSEVTGQSQDAWPSLPSAKADCGLTVCLALKSWGYRKEVWVQLSVSTQLGENRGRC